MKQVSIVFVAIALVGCTELAADRDGGVSDAGPFDAAVVDSGPAPFDIRLLAAAARHTCVASEDRVFCWGYGEQGQLGNGGSSFEPVLEPVETGPLPAPIHALVARSDATCAIAGADQEIFCWGANSINRLGGGPSYMLVPTRMMGSPIGVTQVTIGAKHSCFIAGGQLSCVGSNTGGDLGIGTSDGRFETPQPVPLPGDALDVAATATQADTTCAVVATGGNAVYCWGSNAYLQAGAGSSVMELVSPTEVPGLAGARLLGMGDRFGCAVMSGGTVRCWGDAGDGDLGADRPSSEIPMDVPLGVTADALSVSVGHVLVVASGLLEIHGWGDTGAGRLGLSERVAPLVPSLVETAPEGTSRLSIATGNQHSCYLAHRSDGGSSLYCTGYNFSGQLGTRDQDNRSSWVEITVP